MWTFLENSNLIPRGLCMAWEPSLLWLQAGSDFVIGIAFFSIPLALVLALRRRQAVSFGALFGLFAAFILACGTTRFVSILTLWHPAYWLEGGIKAVAAILSLTTACLVWPCVKGVEQSEAQYRAVG